MKKSKQRMTNKNKPGNIQGGIALPMINGEPSVWRQEGTHMLRSGGLKSCENNNSLCVHSHPATTLYLEA